VIARIFSRFLCVVLALGLALPRPARAGDEISLLRDAEIETIIRTYGTPIWNAAGLDPGAVHVYLVGDPALNSFVAGGQNLFMNSGTILRSETPNQIIGIMAHETGHIAGGHLARGEEAMRDAVIQSMISLIAGLGAAVAGRDGSLGSAVILGSQSTIQRSFLQFSIGQEASADQAGLHFLDQTCQSARGLLEFFEILQQEELLSAAHQDPYLRTHPLTAQRIDTMREHVRTARCSNVKDSAEMMALHARMKAKLIAFLQPPEQTLAKFKPEDTSLPARYARAIAHYRIPDLKKALPEIDALIQDNPRDPYFQELKGQMLFENGRVAEAVGPYEQAVRFLPDNALLRIELAHAQIETNDASLLPKALAHLNEAVRFEDRNPETWQYLAIAYGRSNNMGMMALASAERGIAIGDMTYARQQAARALKLLPPGPAKQRALDLQGEAKHTRGN
jgi:predicted Zn-dependent protease